MNTSRLHELHQKVSEWRTIQIEAVGRQGEGGKLSELAKDVDEMKLTLGEITATQQKMQQKLTGLGIKVAGIVGASVLLAGIIAGAIVKYAMGGL